MNPNLWRSPDKFNTMDAVSQGFYQILLADDHTLIRQGIKRIIEEKADLRIVGEFQDGQELLEALNQAQPQMAILDISMPRLGGIEATRQIKARHPNIKVLILTLHKRQEYVDQARLAGAEGYLLKDEMDKQLLVAIETLRQGRTYLSPFFGDY